MIETRFKKTDIGEIPEDWEVDSLGNIINVLTDYTANGSFASLAENVTYLDCIDYARLVRLTDLRVNFKNDGVYVSKASYNYLKKSKLYGGEILLANVGAYAGYSFVYPPKLPFIGTLGPNMFLIKLDNNKIQNSYGIYIFIYGAVFKQLLSKASSSAQPKLNKDNVRECLFSYPKDKDEQQRIATALTDIDTLLSSLNKKIAKKKLIKQGAMQQLLTGKKRLAGFTEPWVEKELGYVCDIKDGTHQTPKYDLSGIPFYSVETVTNNDFKHVKYISIKEHLKLIQRYRIKKGDVLMTRIGSIGLCKYIDWGVFASFYVSLALLKFENDSLARYFTHYSTTKDFQKEINNHSLQFATPKKINLGNIKLVKIKFPYSKAEQAAIANILSDMDKEIEELEAKRAKYEQVKQGMMQQLLTGKIRLVKNDTESFFCDEKN